MYFEELNIGQSAESSRTVTQEDIVAFAALSGDRNAVHLDPDFAAKTPFKGVIAHGMLSASYISAILGTRLPGEGTIYLGQNLSFLAPVRLPISRNSSMPRNRPAADRSAINVRSMSAGVWKREAGLSTGRQKGERKEKR